MQVDLPWAVEDLVPHAAPMILIDLVRERAPGTLESLVRISEDSPFYEPPGGVPSYVGIEYVAQTVAALAGLRARRADRQIQLGFLLGARRFEASVPCFALGAELTVQVEPEYEAKDIANYRGTITDDSGDVVVTTSVTVYVRGGDRGREQT